MARNLILTETKPVGNMTATWCRLENKPEAPAWWIEYLNKYKNYETQATEFYPYDDTKLAALSEVVAGKTIKSVTVDSYCSEDYLVIAFDDDTELQIHFDYIYSYRII